MASRYEDPPQPVPLVGVAAFVGAGGGDKLGWAGDLGAYEEPPKLVPPIVLLALALPFVMTFGVMPLALLGIPSRYEEPLPPAPLAGGLVVAGGDDGLEAALGGGGDWGAYGGPPKPASPLLKVLELLVGVLPLTLLDIASR